MSHPEQKQFMKLIAAEFPQFFSNCRVLEIGSLDINGSVRELFSDCDYIGLDVAEGKGVDVVCEGQKYDAPDASFDHVLSCEAMEHNPYWLETFNNMARLCRPGGLVIMTCATTGRAEHGTSRTRPGSSPLTVGMGWDYYRNLRSRDFTGQVDLAGLFSTHRFWSNWSSFDLYFCGIRKAPTADPDVERNWADLMRQIDAHINAANGRKICLYRSWAARMFGDKWFTMMRNAIRTLDYAHNS